VKVRSGDDWQTGFVFGTSRQVITSYFVANESSHVEVVGPDHKRREARVVAWSEEADLALLELSEPLVVPPLRAAVEAPWTPEPVAVLYQPQEPDPDSRVAEAWNVPIVMPGHVGRVLPTELDIEVSLYGRPGDYGAPVVTTSGQVIGIISHAPKKRRVIATRVERAQRLLGMSGKQGEFSRSRPVKSFAGIFVSPLETSGLVGAGLDVGFRYGWFALELAEGIYQSGYRPLNSSQFEKKDRFQFELAAELELSLGESMALFIGPAARFNFDSIRTLSSTSSGALDETRSGEVLVRPAVAFGFVGGNLLIRGSYGADSRIDIGLIWGR
jgi:hypothetical protein